MSNYFHIPSERELIERFPGVNLRTFWGDKVMLSIVDLNKGSVVPNHTHPNEQAGIVLEGEMELGINGEKRILKKGEIYVIPGGAEHYAKPHGESCQALDIFAPVREEYKY